MLMRMGPKLKLCMWKMAVDIGTTTLKNYIRVSTKPEQLHSL